MGKYKFMDNIGLKLIAFVFAAFLWLVVVNVDDPVDYTVFRNVPVTIENAEVITNQGKDYRILDETQTVTVTVYAKRSVLSRISSSNVTASADLSEMEVNTLLVPITASVQGFEGRYQSAEVNPKNLQVQIEDRIKNTFPLTVSASGTPRDGYVVGEMTTNPEKIEIRGSESLIASIDRAVARVDVSGLSASSELDGELILYDVNGNPIDQSQLTNNLGEDGLTVNVQMLHTKNVALEFETSGIPEDGYVYGGLQAEPESVQVCGVESEIEQLESITIPAAEVNVDGANEKMELTVDITPYLPEGISLVDESAGNVIVTVTIEREGSRTIELPVESVKVNNLLESLKIEFESNTDITFQFTGPQEALELLDVKNAVSIDLRNYTTAGTYEIPVNVELDSVVELTEVPTVKVVLTQKTTS